MHNHGFHKGGSPRTASAISAVPTPIPPLPPRPSLLQLWSSGALSSSLFLFRGTSPSSITQTPDRSAQMILRIYKPTPLVWTPSALVSTVHSLPSGSNQPCGHYLVDLGGSVNSGVLPSCGYMLASPPSLRPCTPSTVVRY